MPERKAYIGLSGLFAVTLSLTAAAIAEDTHPGYSAFQRCVVCHQADGRGIPGAFPPLKGHIARIATLDEGRAYLIAVLHTGLMGPLQVAGRVYVGVMPAQVPGNDYRQLSQILNYAVEVIDAESGDDDWRPFTAEEVAQRLGVGLPNKMHGVAALRQRLDSQYPELFQAEAAQVKE